MSKSFMLSFAKNAGYFAAGFLGILGLINVLVWVFGKTVAIWLAWIILAVGWVAYITVSKERPLTAAEADSLNDYAKAGTL